MTHRSGGVTVMIAAMSAAIGIGGALTAGSIACGDILHLEGANDGAPSPDDAEFAAEAGALADASCSDADLTKDPKNCGRCGNDCLVGSCADGICQPERIAAFDSSPIRRLAHHGDKLYAALHESGGSPARLVQIDVQAPFTVNEVSAPVDVTESPNGGIAVNGNGLFWGTPNGLRWRPHGGESTQALPTGGAVRGVQVVGNQLVWTRFQAAASPSNHGTIGQCPTASCAVSTTMPKIEYPLDAIVVEDEIYWLGYGNNPGFFFHASVASNRIFGGKQLDPSPMVADKARIYWSTLNGVSVFDTQLETLGSALATTAMNERVHGIAITSGTLYLTRLMEVLRCALSTQGTCGTPEPIASGEGEAIDVVVDGPLLYWGTKKGFIYRIRRE